jgi:two-component system chemotaxis response regulator CheB
VTPPTRVLIVDDAVVVRRILTDVIQAEPGLQVAGTASNGRLALAKIPQVNPDIVTLDVEMPEMNGLETLKAIRATYPDLPVIMFSTLTERGGKVTLEALMSGANEYVTKPANVGSIAEGIAAVRDQLVPKIRALCKVAEPPPRRAPSPCPATSHARPAAAPPVTAAPSAAPSRIDILAVGVSTGGPNALASFLGALPAELPVPLVIVQHMPPMFTRLLAERLDTVSPLTVAEARSGVPLARAHAWIAPGDAHLLVRTQGAQAILELSDAPPENSCRPSADVLFRSVAQVYGPRALGIVLTGMGQDGLRGCEHLRAAGSSVVAQDEASSVVWGMPGAVANAGLADRVIPLDQMARAVVARLRFGRAAVDAPMVAVSR